MHSFLEPRLRHLVAETLGVDVEELSPDVSLTDDLAADSLDLAELAISLENELGMAIPDHIVERIRTYGDVVRTALALTSTPPAPPRRGDPVSLWARLVTPHGELLRADFLTPYVTEMLSEDAVRAGHGARLEVKLGARSDDAQVARVREEFAWLARHGVDVTVERDGRSHAHYPSAAA